MKTETQEVLEQVLSEEEKRANMSDREAAERDAADKRGRAAGAEAGRLRVLLYLPGEELWRSPEAKEEGENAVYYRGGWREAYRSAANPVDLEVEDGEACYSIPAAERRVGMVVRVKANRLTFVLSGGITNEHWAPYHAAQSARYGYGAICGVKRADGAPCTLGAGHADHSYAGSRFQAEPSASGCGCNCCSGCSNVLQVLANMGHDTTCGACMSQAFTGSDGGHAHSCARG